MSFQQGLSGLNATSKSLEVIGHNIANANTIGSKTSRAEFSDVYASSLYGVSSSGVGLGAVLDTVAQQFTQGGITTTANSLDLAINGAGFFQVQSESGPAQYTRNGQFKLDRDGFIVNNERQRLMGYPADKTGVVIPGTTRPLQFTTAGIEPNPTTMTRIETNFDSRSAITNPGTGAVPQISFGDPTTYNNATSVTVYDAKGQDVAMTYYFQKAGNDQWNVFATANGVPVNGSAADPQPITAAPIEFAADGSGPLADVSALPISITGTIVTDSGALIVTPIDLTLSLNGATQYGAGFSVTDLTQNGYSAGQLTSITIEGDGIVTARYSNGQSKPAGQLELATFRNPQGLQPLGGNVWANTYASGDPVLGTPGTGSMGVLQAGALEESNVDLTGELVNMITAQRIYQANAQTIKTQDQILQTLVNLR